MTLNLDLETALAAVLAQLPGMAAPPKVKPSRKAKPKSKTKPSSTRRASVRNLTRPQFMDFQTKGIYSERPHEVTRSGPDQLQVAFENRQILHRALGAEYRARFLQNLLQETYS